MPHYIYIAENEDLYTEYPDEVVVKIGITEQSRKFRENTLNGILDGGAKYAEYKDGKKVVSSEWIIRPQNFKKVSSPVAEDVIQDSVIKDGGKNITGHYRIQDGKPKLSIELFSIPHNGRFVFTKVRKPILNTGRIHFGGGPITETSYETVSVREERNFEEDITNFLQSITKKMTESEQDAT